MGMDRDEILADIAKNRPQVAQIDPNEPDGDDDHMCECPQCGYVGLMKNAAPPSQQ